MIEGVDEMVENVIQSKSKKMINIDVNVRNNWTNSYIREIIYGILAQVLVSKDIWIIIVNIKKNGKSLYVKMNQQKLILVLLKKIFLILFLDIIANHVVCGI